MGTNYSHRYNACDCCGRYEEAHVCKNLTSFSWLVDEHDNVLVASWAEWKSRLLAGGTVVDEYGVTHDTEKFIEQVEATTPEARRKHYDWLVDHGAGSVGVEPGTGVDWLDADGFSFYGGEFW